MNDILLCSTKYRTSGGGKALGVFDFEPGVQRIVSVVKVGVKGRGGVTTTKLCCNRTDTYYTYMSAKPYTRQREPESATTEAVPTTVEVQSNFLATLSRILLLGGTQESG